MKYEENQKNQKIVSKTIVLSKEKKEGKISLNNEYIKNCNISLLLRKEEEKQKEIEKANSTTQTRQKSLIISNDEIVNHNINKNVYRSINKSISKTINKAMKKIQNKTINKSINKNIYKSIHKSLYDNFYNSERSKKTLKNNNHFLFADKLYTKSNTRYTKGKIFLQKENEQKKTDDINNNNNIYVINKKPYKINNLTIKNIYYNTIIDNYNQKKKISKDKDNNIDMYHYYDLNQRRIERIIPKINEYLDNNTNNKKMFKANNNKTKSININNDDNLQILIQRSNFNYKPKIKENSNNKKFKVKKRNKNYLRLKSEKFDLCLFNSLYNKNSKNKIILASSDEKRVKKLLSLKTPFKKKNFWNLDNVNISINNKMRVSAFNHTYTQNH